jgi:shikimate dehydrogenase
MSQLAAPAGPPVLSGTTKLAGIAGWPVAHSRSPRLHGFWLNRHRIDGAYVPLPIRAEDFATAIHGLRAAGFRGMNVTAPHKLAAFAVCDVVDETARRAGAVNTIVFSDQGIRGSNTDGSGFVANLRASGVEPAAGPVLLLGAGGGARAVAAALLADGVPVTLANRSPEPAAALAAQLPGLAVIAWEARDAALADHALLVNATSLGMKGNPPLAIGLDRAAPGLAVADIVYAPLETPLLAAARARGMRAVDGLGMLLHQAGVGFEAWFGVKPTVDGELRRFVAGDLIAESAPAR